MEDKGRRWGRNVMTVMDADGAFYAHLNNHMPARPASAVIWMGNHMGVMWSWAVWFMIVVPRIDPHAHGVALTHPFR